MPAWSPSSLIRFAPPPPRARRGDRAGARHPPDALREWKSPCPLVCDPVRVSGMVILSGDPCVRKTRVGKRRDLPC
jgi:hypothetical protein